MFVYINKVLLADKLKIADNFVAKLVGLLGKKGLESGEGLLLKNCSSVHCFFMQFPIDVVYLSKDMRVLFVETVKPWHIGSFVRKTRHIIELPAGAAKTVSVGTQIEIFVEMHLFQ